MNKDIKLRARAFFEDWLAASERSDAAWFETHLADDFFYHNSGGGRMDKGGIIAINQKTSCIYALQVTELVTRGTISVLSGTYHAKGTVPDDPELAAEMIKKYAAGVVNRFALVIELGSDGLSAVALQTTSVPS